MLTKHHRHTRAFFAIFCILIILLPACSRGADPTPESSGARSLPQTEEPVWRGETPTAAPTPARGEDASPVPAAYWPTGGWLTSTPAEQGMDPAQLTALLDEIEQKKLAFHSLLIIRHGYIVSETYFGGNTQDTLHEQYSVTKSFASTLIGIALDQGLISRVDQRVVDFFPDRQFMQLDDQKKSMTLDDLLTMRSGLDWKEEDASFSALYRSQDWVTYMFDLPMAHAPGESFLYCSGCSHILSAIVEKVSGENTRDFAETNLFAPLGIQNANWSTSPAGTPIGGWGLQITPRDMAKLGYLFLHQGQWDGKQIVSAGWVGNATQTHTDAGSLGYGYQWWTHPTLKAYMALGRFGQMVMVIPGADLVIVTTAGMDNHDEIFRLVEKYIVPALK